jgi:hypothetical protein
MKKSNMIVGGIALAILGLVIVCLAAFREKPEWRSEQRAWLDPANEQKEIANMMAFANRCNLVEELVLKSSTKVKGRTSVSDTNQFRLTSIGDAIIDTLFENEGKKLSFTIEPKKDGRIVYYFLQLLLPALKKVSCNNVELSLKSYRLPTLALSLQGESGCFLKTDKGISRLEVDIKNLSALFYTPPPITDSIFIKASGNALVQLPETIAKQLQQQGKLILQENAIVQ